MNEIEIKRILIRILNFICFYTEKSNWLKMGSYYAPVDIDRGSLASRAKKELIDLINKDHLYSNWIDIDDALPEEGQNILACGWDCRDHVRSGLYSTIEYEPVVEYGDCFLRFKYWQPAPEVPEEIKEKFQR